MEVLGAGARLGIHHAEVSAITGSPYTAAEHQSIPQRPASAVVIVGQVKGRGLGCPK